MQLPWNEIGGGFVTRGFTRNGERLRVGTELDADAIKSLGNAKALVRAGFLKIYPPKGADAEPEGVTRHIVHNGGGRYDVIAGVRLNSAPMTKDAAEELATRPN